MALRSSPGAKRARERVARSATQPDRRKFEANILTTFSTPPILTVLSFSPPYPLIHLSYPGAVRSAQRGAGAWRGGHGMVALAPRNGPYPVSRMAAALRATLAARFAAWQYVGDRRDLRFDLLRGLAVVAMITDHVGGDQSWLYHLTGGNRFWTSAAEGFVFISGLVMGMVYAGVLARQGLRAMLLKALKRAWTLYALTVLLTFATAAAAYHFQLFWAPQVTLATLPDFVVSILTIHRTFYLTDILL